MSQVIVITPAASSRLTTVAAVTAQLPTAGTALVDALIDSASAAIATYCHRVWGQEVVTETLAGSGSRYLGLTRTPILSVGTVTQEGTAITDYSIWDAAAGSLYREIGWYRGLALGWGYEAYSSGYILGPWSSPYSSREPLPNYAVSYTAGYVLPGTAGTATLPADVQQACIETVKAWTLGAARDPALTRMQAGDVSESYGQASMQSGAAGLPPLAQTLLKQWVQPPYLAGQ